MDKQRLLGEFPVFAEQSGLTETQTVKGTIVGKQNPNEFLEKDTLAYKLGFGKIDKEILNGAMQFVTYNLSYLFEKGIPQFTVGMAYDEGAVVSFNKGIYVSLTNNNLKHVTQTSHWNKVMFEPNSSVHNDCTGSTGSETNTGFPIGTILTVAKYNVPTGFIPYVSGTKFDEKLYPELYKAMGTNQFGTVNDTVSDSVPVGSVMYSLSTDTLPTGWIDVESVYDLRQYPELLKVLQQTVRQLPVEYQAYWNSSLNSYKLPDLTGLFVTKDTVGKVTGATIPESGLAYMPVVIDDTTTLNPLGYCRETEEQLQTPILGGEVSASTYPCNYVLLGSKASKFQGLGNLTYSVIKQNQGSTEIKPKSIGMRMIIKYRASTSGSIPDTHVQIIKAF